MVNIRDITECIWNRSSELSYSALMVATLERWKQKGGWQCSKWEIKHCCHRCEIDKAEQLLREDRKLLLRELSGNLNVSLERVHHIIIVEWGMSWVCARWRPHTFSDQQKWKCVEIWKWNVPLDEQNPWTFIVDNHLWWSLGYDIMTQNQNSSQMFRNKDLPPSRKFRTAP
jgi:hypothetical protein